MFRFRTNATWCETPTGTFVVATAHADAETDRQTDPDTHAEADRQADAEADSQSDAETDRQTDPETDPQGRRHAEAVAQAPPEREAGRLTGRDRGRAVAGRSTVAEPVAVPDTEWRRSDRPRHERRRSWHGPDARPGRAAGSGRGDRREPAARLAAHRRRSGRRSTCASSDAVPTTSGPADWHSRPRPQPPHQELVEPLQPGPDSRAPIVNVPVQQAQPVSVLPTAAAARVFEKGPAKGVERATVGYHQVRISSKPDELRSEELGRLDRGDEVEIVDLFEGFLQIRTPDGTVGWIQRHVTVGPPKQSRPVSDQASSGPLSEPGRRPSRGQPGARVRRGR